MLLDENAPETEPRGDRGDLPGVVGLDAADRDEGVAALRERVRARYSSLHLVPPVREPGVAVLPLRPQLDSAAEVLAQALEVVDGDGPKSSSTRG